MPVTITNYQSSVICVGTSGLLLLDRHNMFRGKMLPDFLCRYAQLYEAIVGEEGMDKMLKVYDYTFRMVSNMQWGQYMRLDRVCPDLTKRQMFYWCLEMIYQSDLLSQMRFARSEGSKEYDIIEVVPPSSDNQQKFAVLLGNRRYLHIDWYRRLLADPKSNDDIDPSWLMLDGGEADSVRDAYEAVNEFANADANGDPD